MANPNVTALPTYVEQGKRGLIVESVLGAPSIENLTIQQDIKDSATLDILETTVEFQTAGAGFTSKGGSKVSQRKLQTGQIKVDMEFDKAAVLKTWMNREMKVNGDVMAFSKEYVEGISGAIATAIEKAIWQGDTAASNTDANTNKFDGFIKLMTADTEVIDVIEADVKGRVDAIVENLPEIYNDTVIYVGSDDFRVYAKALVDANMYSYNGMTDFKTILVPGTEIKVISTPGLNGTDTMVGSRVSNLFYGCDMQSDSEDFTMDYDKKTDSFYVKVRFNSGVQYAFGKEVVMGKKA